MKAFPIWTNQGIFHSGMELRDYFAAKAMQEFCKEFDDDAHLAKIAYKIADAMMKARNSD